MITEKKISNKKGKSIALVTLCVLLALSVVFVMLGITGLKLDSQGLRRLLPWIPNMHEKSEWKTALTPDINFGENDSYVLSIENADEADKTFKVISERVKLLQLPVLVKKADNAITIIAQKDSMNAQFLSLLTDKGNFTFADSEGVDFLSSEHIVKADRMPADQSGANWYLSFAFDEEGKKIFAEKSTELVGKKIKLKLNGQTVTEAQISEPLVDGAASLPGFTEESSLIYTVYMRSGALANDVKLGEKQLGEPLYGKDALNRMVLVICVFLVACVIIVSVGYRLSGINAAWTLVIAFAAQWWFAALTKMQFSVSTLVAVILLNVLTLTSLVMILMGMSKDISEGNGVKQALRSSYKTNGKIAFYAHAIVFALVVIAMIIDSQMHYKLLLQMLCVGTLISLLASHIFFKVLMNNSIKLFGEKAALFYK